MNSLKSFPNKTEPFISSSGEKIFISQSVRDTFEKLSHNILSGTGLQLVIGAAGAGKTSLLNQLSQKFRADSKTVVLLLDNPQFSDLQQFLITLAGTFKTIKAPSAFDDILLQKAFNSFYYKLCLQEKKTVLLLIDNGQNLPDFCLNALNSFYDHHPDCRKMLQTVICGKNSLLRKINTNKSLRSHVHFATALKPLGFKDTRRFILFLQEFTASDSCSLPAPFTTSAQWAIYHMTRGHPKKIIDLFHFIVLTLGIENRKKVDWFLTLRCAKLLMPHPAQKLQIIQAATLSALAGLILVLGLWSGQIKTLIVSQPEQQFEVTTSQKVEPPEPQPSEPVKITQKTIPPVKTGEGPTAVYDSRKETPQPDKLTEEQIKGAVPAEKSATIPDHPNSKVPTGQIVELESAKITSTTEIKPESQTDAFPGPVDKRVEPPEYLGDIITAPGDTFGDMIRGIYGPKSFNPENVKTVMAVNQDLKSPELLSVGYKVRFPVIPVVLTSKAEEVWWVRITIQDNIQSAYRFLRQYRESLPPMLIIPSRDNSGQVLMNVLLEEFFVDKESAQKAIQELPLEIAAQTQALYGLSPATFYYRLKENE
jgi:general secretion pathway protein A